MLVVLAEINCLSSIKALGVHPDVFYTDLEQFKNDMATFRDATIIVVFAGNCRFNKRVTINIIKGLLKRASSGNDVGIKNVYVFSDLTISGLYQYYKYDNEISKCNVMRGWNPVRKNVCPWVRLRNEEHETVCKMSKYDMGDSTDAHEAYEKRQNTEDQYIDLIKVPDIQKLLASI